MVAVCKDQQNLEKENWVRSRIPVALTTFLTADQSPWVRSDHPVREEQVLEGENRPFARKCALWYPLHRMIA